VGRGGVLTELERDCMERYSALLRGRLGERLVEIRLTRGEIPGETRDELLNETYPLFVECGRQLSPQFRDKASIYDPAPCAT
jgi:hypothetical protein